MSELTPLDRLRTALASLPPEDAEEKVADMLDAYDVDGTRAANDVMARIYLGGYVLVRASDLRAALAAQPEPAGPTPYIEVRTTACHAGMDGDCSWSDCPQLRDGEPVGSGRHCPLDMLRGAGLRGAAQAVEAHLAPTEADANYRLGSPSEASQRLRAALAAQPESAGLPSVEAIEDAIQAAYDEHDNHRTRHPGHAGACQDDWPNASRLAPLVRYALLTAEKP